MPLQAAAQGYGITADINKFNVSSSFTFTGGEDVYAVVDGTILLQQQQSSPDKVNLILRPYNQKNIKLPIKYIIYRGLRISDFLDSSNISDPANKVKTSGSELLTKMQAIQTQRAPGTAIPVEALFGNELTPAATKNIDDFFFKNQAPSSQLFTIDCGMEMGKFSAGEVSIEVILENPEFFVNVELAKRAKHEIDVASISDPAQKKWTQDLVRHFVDPAAFFGFHHDIIGGIEYRTAVANKLVANTPVLVYQQLIEKFSTKNKVYLDLRNENGYSYNYYNNYKGTGADASKNIKVGQSLASMVNKEYSTNGWAVHVIDITAGSTAENEIHLAFRINDNERPIIAGWNIEISPNTVIDPPLSNTTTRRMYFVDETSLLPVPIPNPLPEFTNAISLKVPNALVSTPAQLATIVKLDYIKQLRLNDGADAFPQQNPTDYLFGPINIQIPWDSQDGVQWIGSNHQKYFDGINHGITRIVIAYNIAAVNVGLNEFTVSGLVGSTIINNMYTLKAGSLSSPFNIVSITENSAGNQTVIKVQEAIPSTIGAGDFILAFVDKLAIADYQNQSFIIPNEDLTSIPSLASGGGLWHHFKLDIDDVNRKYVIDNVSFQAGNTVIKVTTPIKKYGLSAMMQTGMVSETNVNTTTTDTDNVLLYAVPNYYFNKTGSADSHFFNYKGGRSSSNTFFDEIKKFDPKFYVSRTTVEMTPGVFKNLITHNSGKGVKENILLLTVTKTEWNTLLNQTNTPVGGKQFSNFHIKVCKLVRQGGLQKSIDFKPYYRYKLVIAGLDTTGSYIQTLEANGVNVYSIDGITFSSDDYAKTITASTATSIINFKRRSDYASKGGHYGFDWMRSEYIAETDITNPTTPQTLTGRGGICIPNVTNITKAQAQDALKQEFTPLSIGGHQYYVPWLSMYENHATVVADGGTVIPAEHEVKLEMSLDPRSTASTGTVTFDVPQGMEVIFNDATGNIVNQPINISNINSIIATVKCHQKNSADRKIFIKDERNNAVGALNVLRNSEKLRCDVRFVKFNLRGTLTGGDRTVAFLSNQVNYTAGSSDIYLGTNKQSTQSLTLNQNLNEWKTKINNSERSAKNLMRQSLIKYNPIKLANGDIDLTRQVTIDFGNYTIGNVLPATSPLNRFKNKLTGVQANGNLIFNDLQESDLIEFINIIKDIYISAYPINDETVTVFVFPCNVIADFLRGTAGAANGIDNAKCVLLNDRTTFDIDKTLQHEISHTLGLPHTFQTGLLGIHSFEQYHTENIMDYMYPTGSTSPAPHYRFGNNDYGISYYKWQVETLKQDPDLKTE
ncbi:hypothetical protein CEY12_07480 [Chryseobacterium sp. T16E-39]|nr:hypothetical protein CEY12_07480 [Chryseobacterium sp. T16E-39]